MKNRLGVKILFSYLVIALYTIIVFYVFDKFRSKELLSDWQSASLTVCLIFLGTGVAGYFYSTRISKDFAG